MGGSGIVRFFAATKILSGGRPRLFEMDRLEWISSLLNLSPSMHNLKGIQERKWANVARGTELEHGACPRQSGLWG
jgi:hypothetical protein